MEQKSKVAQKANSYAKRLAYRKRNAPSTYTQITKKKGVEQSRQLPMPKPLFE